MEPGDRGNMFNAKTAASTIYISQPVASIQYVLRLIQLIMFVDIYILFF